MHARSLLQEDVTGRYIRGEMWRAAQCAPGAQVQTMYTPRLRLESTVLRIPIAPGSCPRTCYGDLSARGVRGIVLEVRPMQSDVRLGGCHIAPEAVASLTVSLRRPIPIFNSQALFCFAGLAI